MFEPGDTYQAAHDSPSQDRHLWVVLSRPDNKGDVLCVNLTARGNLPDESCVLREGDHPFIKKESIVNYMDAQINSLEKLISACKEELIIKQDSFEKEVLVRIRRGAIQSDYIKQKHLEYLEEDSL